MFSIDSSVEPDSLSKLSCTAPSAYQFETIVNVMTSYYPSQCNCPATTDGLSLANACGGSQFVLFMGLLETLLRTQCDIEQPCNRPQSITTPQHEYDFIVVGGGAGGSVMAARLSEVADWRVLLIEIGGHEPIALQVPCFAPLYHHSFHNYRTEPNHRSNLGSPGNRTEWGAAQVLGGQTVMNGMHYLRGNPDDYDGWQRMGNEGWAYEDVLPYFRKAEDLQPGDPAAVVDRDLHGVGGPQPVTPVHIDTDEVLVRGAIELGWQRTDLNGRNGTGFDSQSMAHRNVRHSTAKAYLWPVANRRRNLDVWLHARVTRILIEGPRRRRRAVGVEVSSGGRTWRVRAAKEVIVSGGSVESPKLLLLSGIGRAAELRRVGVRPLVELPGVGRNLQNHMGLMMIMKSPEVNTYHMNWDMAAEYLTKRTGKMGLRTRLINIKIAGSYAKSSHIPDLQIVLGTEFATYGDRCSRTGDPTELPEVRTQRPSALCQILQPLSRGSVSLSSADPLVDARIYPNELDADGDVDRLIDCMRRVETLLQTEALRSAGVTVETQTPDQEACRHLAAGSDAQLSCRIRHSAFELRHPVGTCGMGRRPGDPMAVVDAQLRVRGVRRLRVVDGSVMPRIVSGYTNAPIVMIAEKAADAVKWEWGAIEADDELSVFS